MGGVWDEVDVDGVVDGDGVDVFEVLGGGCG